MSALTGHLAEELDICLGTRIQHIRKNEDAMIPVDSHDEAMGKFDAIVVTPPPQQAARLLDGLTPLADRLSAVHMTPCWAVLLAFAKPLDLPFDGVFIHDADIAWAARDFRKPGRETNECWVLHATAAWSLAHLALTPEEVIPLLMRSFSAAIGRPLPDPVLSMAHRWRYAQAQKPLTAGCLWDRQSRIGICGDWCYGSRIEGAFLSGTAMAGRILADAPRLRSAP